MVKTGRVIRIFDDKKIAVSLGSTDGITSDTQVSIYAPPVEVEDPDSGDSLGTYRYLKARGRITQLAERFAVVGPYPRREKVQEEQPAFNYLFRPKSTTRTVPGRFDINEADAIPLPTGSEIRVGDIAEVEVEDEVQAEAEATTEVE